MELRVELRSVSFYNHTTKQVQKSIWKELEAGLWRSFDVDNFIYNQSLPCTGQRKTEYRPIFKDISPIYPGHTWDWEQGCLREERFYPRLLSDVSWDSFMEVARNFFARFEGKRIGVHLSGGLDSSLIMALLKYLKIPFVAVGLTSERWEFRTERAIQECVGQWAEDALLLDMENYWNYAEEDYTCEPYPYSLCYVCQTEQALIDAFVERQVDVVFTGQGGDSVLIDAVPEDGQGRGFNLKNEFRFALEEEWYASYGMELVSFFADENIIEQLVNLRRGEGEDTRKVWARQFFRKILPRELSEYVYKADYVAYWIRNLEEMKTQIRPLFERAYRLLGHQGFNESAIRELEQENLNALESDDFSRFSARFLIAIWLRGLCKGGIIKEY